MSRYDPQIVYKRTSDQRHDGLAVQFVVRGVLPLRFLACSSRAIAALNHACDDAGNRRQKGSRRCRRRERASESIVQTT
jgi:hypothetical protein